jgi:hypothetical protein
MYASESATVLLGPGVHDVDLQVYDDEGASSVVSFTIDVDDPTGDCS